MDHPVYKHFSSYQRPSGRVLYRARVVLGGVDLPQLLDADPVDLLLAAGLEVEVAHQLLGQLTPAAFAEDGALGVELHAALEALLGSAVLADAHVVGSDS